jgi:hypothetical protein
MVGGIRLDGVHRLLPSRPSLLPQCLELSLHGLKVTIIAGRHRCAAFYRPMWFEVKNAGVSALWAGKKYSAVW